MVNCCRIDLLAPIIAGRRFNGASITHRALSFRARPIIRLRRHEFRQIFLGAKFFGHRPDTPQYENGGAKVCHGSGGIVLLRAA